MQTSVFSSYFLPGLILLFIVGGSALVAAIALIRKQRRVRFLSFLSAVILLVFETVEVIAIGSPEGARKNLQIFYFALGFIIAILSVMLPWIPRKSETVEPQ